MNIFDLLGYRSDRPYSVQSKTNLGYFALVNGGSTQSYVLSANYGTYTISGQDSVFNKSVSLSAEQGSYSINGQDADLVYQEAPLFVIESKGGLPKAKSTKKYKEESELRAELEKIVKEQFDKLDGTYVPEVVEKTKAVFIPKVNKIDLSEYDQAISQVNALLLQIKSKAAEYEAELDDEEAILMLL